MKSVIAVHRIFSLRAADQGGEVSHAACGVAVRRAASPAARAGGRRRPGPSGDPAPRGDGPRSGPHSVRARARARSTGRSKGNRTRERRGGAPERDLALGRGHLWQHRHERCHQRQEPEPPRHLRPLFVQKDHLAAAYPCSSTRQRAIPKLFVPSSVRSQAACAVGGAAGELAVATRPRVRSISSLAPLTSPSVRRSGKQGQRTGHWRSMHCLLRLSAVRKRERHRDENDTN